MIDDEVECVNEEMAIFEKAMEERLPESKFIEFRSFMEETPYHHHLHYLSVLRYHNPMDFVADMREKMQIGWRVFLFTKHPEEYRGLFAEKNINFAEWKNGEAVPDDAVILFGIDKDEVFPEAFQNPGLKVQVISDRDISGVTEAEKRAPQKQQAYMDFLTGLKVNDFVVHSNHGIGQFLGLDKKTVYEVTREYLKIGYAENDRLFVPIDQADKVSKYIGAGDRAPKLTRLGSAEGIQLRVEFEKKPRKLRRNFWSFMQKDCRHEERHFHLTQMRWWNLKRSSNMKLLRVSTVRFWMLSEIWKIKNQWIGLCVEMLDLEKQRLQCGPRSRLFKTESRLRFWRRLQFL